MFLQLMVNGLISGCGYVLVSLGMSLVFGVLNVINVAHGMFYAIGAYVFLSLSTALGIGFWQSVVIVMLIMSIIGFIIERIIFKPLRLEGHIMQIIAANGLAIFLVDFIRVAWTADSVRLKTPYLANNLTLFNGISLTEQRLLIVISTVVIVVLITLLYRKTKFGLMMRALPQDDVAAKLNGININIISGVTFAIAAAVAGLGAVMLGPTYTVMPTIGDTLGNKAFAIVILGGIGSVGGTVVAGLIVGILESLVSGYIAAGYENLITFILLIVTLVLRPSGLMGQKQQ